MNGFISNSRYLTGGTFFFTVKPADPKARLLVKHINLLCEAYAFVQQRYPFETVALCILPNHIHAVWALPDEDDDYSLRWRLLKTRFSNHFPAMPQHSESKQRWHEKGIWQRRFYEHTIRDEADLRRCVGYVYINPVKHGLVEAVRDWPFSSFHRDVGKDLFPQDWGGTKEAEAFAKMIPVAPAQAGAQGKAALCLWLGFGKHLIKNRNISVLFDYSGLDLNQDKAGSRRQLQLVRQGRANAVLVQI